MFGRKGFEGDKKINKDERFRYTHTQRDKEDYQIGIRFWGGYVVFFFVVFLGILVS